MRRCGALLRRHIGSALRKPPFRALRISDLLSYSPSAALRASQTGKNSAFERLFAACRPLRNDSCLLYIKEANEQSSKAARQETGRAVGEGHMNAARRMREEQCGRRRPHECCSEAVQGAEQSSKAAGTRCLQDQRRMLGASSYEAGCRPRRPVVIRACSAAGFVKKM